MLDKHELSKKQQFLNNFSNFLTKYRIYLIVLLSVIIVGLVTFVIVREVIDSRAEKSALLAEDLQRDYQDWLTSVDDAERETLEERCRDQVQNILDSYPRTYASQRALLVLGNLDFQLEAYSDAELSFRTLRERFPDSYLAATALWNLSAVYERTEDSEAAYDALVTLENDYRGTYPDMPHVLFNLGRLMEADEDYSAAAEWYNNLIDNYPQSNWTKLARDRIIFLKIRSLIEE